jgi:two-component system chemotaxis response regulator CheY
MSGLDLLENLRMNQTTRSIGFILVTGTPDQEILERGQRLGLNNLIKKPFTTQSLKSAVEAVVGRL